MSGSAPEAGERERVAMSGSALRPLHCTASLQVTKPAIRPVAVARKARHLPRDIDGGSRFGLGAGLQLVAVSEAVPL